MPALRAWFPMCIEYDPVVSIAKGKCVFPAECRPHKSRRNEYETLSTSLRNGLRLVLANKTAGKCCRPFYFSIRAVALVFFGLCGLIVVLFVVNLAAVLILLVVCLFLLLRSQRAPIRCALIVHLLIKLRLILIGTGRFA